MYISISAYAYFVVWLLSLYVCMEISIWGFNVSDSFCQCPFQVFGEQILLLWQAPAIWKVSWILRIQSVSWNLGMQMIRTLSSLFLYHSPASFIFCTAPPTSFISPYPTHRPSPLITWTHHCHHLSYYSPTTAPPSHTGAYQHTWSLHPSHELSDCLPLPHIYTTDPSHYHHKCMIVDP